MSAITISEAARRLGLSQQDASLLIRASGYKTKPSPHGGNAQLVGKRGYAILQRAAANLGRRPATVPSP